MQNVATKTEREGFGVFTLFGADADIAANQRSGMISTLMDMEDKHPGSQCVGRARGRTYCSVIQNIFIHRYRLSVCPSLFERTISLVKVRIHVQEYRQEGVRS